MARYGIYPNPSGDGYLLDIQTDILAEFGTRLVAPLTPMNTGPIAVSRLHPVFDVEGVPHIMLTHLLGAVPSKLLKAPVADASDHFAEISSALDMVFQGY